MAIADPQTMYTPGEERFVLRNIPWQAYLAISDALEDRAAPRITFAEGKLEFMTPSAIHEILKKSLSGIIETMAEESGMAIESAGAMTFRRDDLGHAFELDDCFWIQNEAAVRGMREFDLRRDPPPDLGIEIEITQSAIDRLDLMATLGVREVWRYDGETLRVEVLQADGAYRQADRSPTFPWAPLEELAAMIEPAPNVDSLTRKRELRAWIARRRNAAEGS